jgi:penicillin-binding protein 1A
MQLYAEEAVARHMACFAERIQSNNPTLNQVTIWKEFNNQLEAAVKQTDRWRNAKEGRPMECRNS